MVCLPRLLRGFILAVLLFATSLHAIKLETRQEPQGKLKISLDFDLVNWAAKDNELAHNRRWILSTYLVFKDYTESITDGQLKKLAVDAWQEMQKDHEQYTSGATKAERRSSLPFVMTVMAFDNKIMLASSQKGSRGFWEESDGNPISEALAICSRHWYQAHHDRHDIRNERHKNQAWCGEGSAFWLYSQLPKQHPHKIGDLQPKARVTTVTKRAGRISIIEPCGTDLKDKWGCDLLVTEGEKVNYIMDDLEEESYDLEDLAGGTQNIGHIGACTRDY